MILMELYWNVKNNCWGWHPLVGEECGATHLTWIVRASTGGLRGQSLLKHPTDRKLVISPQESTQFRSVSAPCSDITNTLVGISGETVPEGGNLRIYWPSNHAIWWVVVFTAGVSHHTPPPPGGRGVQLQFLIFWIFYNNKLDRKQTHNSTISLFLLASACIPPPMGGHVTGNFPLFEKKT